MPVKTETLPKEERISSKNDIGRLMSKGSYGNCGPIRYCFLGDNGLEINRMMVSVPKRNFKRAVRRNLLKRRIREAYRTQKSDAAFSSTDILFIYTAREVLPYSEIRDAVGKILSKIPS